MPRPKHSEAATKSALTIATLYLPMATAKDRSQIAGIIDQNQHMYGLRPESAPSPDDLFHADDPRIPPGVGADKNGIES